MGNVLHFWRRCRYRPKELSNFEEIETASRGPFSALGRVLGRFERSARDAVGQIENLGPHLDHNGCHMRQELTGRQIPIRVGSYDRLVL